jgi:hypothetical protein
MSHGLLLHVIGLVYQPAYADVLRGRYQTNGVTNVLKPGNAGIQLCDQPLQRGDVP